MDGFAGAPELVFTAFGLLLQALLLGFFAGRRWAPRATERYGWIVYAFGMLGLPIGLWLLVDGQSWRLFAGPLLAAAWAGFGTWVDLVRPRPWRAPIDWPVLGPYFVLYLAAQMFLWWPLWDINRVAWVLYLALFVPSTLLNIVGHAGGGQHDAGGPRG